MSASASDGPGVHRAQGAHLELSLSSKGRGEVDKAVSGGSDIAFRQNAWMRRGSGCCRSFLSEGLAITLGALRPRPQLSFEL